MSLKSAILKQNVLREFRREIGYYKIRNWYANLVKPKRIPPPYNHIVQIGDPILRSKAEHVEPEKIQSKEVQTLLQRMAHVSSKYNCMGLAAPQVGVPLRVIMVQINSDHLKDYSKEEINGREMSLQPLKVLINPEINITDYTKIVYPESCVSVRGYWAEVARYRSLDVKGYDENGSITKLSAKGWLARVIQHEMDHLDGKVYTDVMDRKTLTCACWSIINERNGKVNMPFGPE